MGESLYGMGELLGDWTNLYTDLGWHRNQGVIDFLYWSFRGDGSDLLHFMNSLLDKIWEVAMLQPKESLESIKGLKYQRCTLSVQLLLLRLE